MRRTVPLSSRAPTRPTTAPLALTPQQRTVLTLRYDADGQPHRPHRAIATELGCSPAYVAKVERRAISRLDVFARAVAQGLPLPAEQAADWLRFQMVWRAWPARAGRRLG